MKLYAASIDDARNGRRARPPSAPASPTGRRNRRHPTLWSECVAYVVDDDPKATVDDQDLITAVAAGVAKLRPADDTRRK